MPVREFEAGGDSRSLSKGVPRLRDVDDGKKRMNAREGVRSS